MPENRESRENKTKTENRTDRDTENRGGMSPRNEPTQPKEFGGGGTSGSKPQTGGQQPTRKPNRET